MSEAKWAALVYGRSYQLDFRFIAIPDDFDRSEITWASPYIFATTRKARKLSAYPRWSLFKNASHCVVGVTCMVRDLVSSLDPDLAAMLSKDDRGRPLYIFVGYVAQLNDSHQIELPPYTGNYLQDFAPLYQYVRRVWTVEDYQQDSKKPLITNYQTVSFSAAKHTASEAIELNHKSKHPDRVFLWQNELQNNLRLWSAAAACPHPLSLCLNINSKQYFANSPFLNQTITELESFTTGERIVNRKNSSLKPQILSKRSLSQKIERKVKQDLEITIYHANYAATIGKELVENFTEWSQVKSLPDDRQDAPAKTEDSFGFKQKESTTDNADWF